MSLFSRTGFQHFVEAMPGTSLIDQWESSVAKVGDKVFGLITDAENRLTFKVTEESFEILTALEGIDQAPYFAKRKWVSVSPVSALTAEEAAEYLRRSYGLVSAGLTRKLRIELGIPL